MPRNRKKNANPKDALQDPRFARIASDPRFSRPRVNDLKVKVDERFSKMLKDKEFTRTAKIDRYGRELVIDKAQEDLDRFYNFDGSSSAGSDSDSSSDSSDNDEDATPSEADSDEAGVTAEPAYDPARGVGVASSSDESDVEVATDDESDADSVPQGEATRRFAAVRMDWKHIKARDLFHVFSMYKPKNGSILSVKIYPSEFGKKQLAQEALHGPMIGKLIEVRRHEPGNGEETASGDEGSDTAAPSAGESASEEGSGSDDNDEAEEVVDVPTDYEEDESEEDGVLGQTSGTDDDASASDSDESDVEVNMREIFADEDSKDYDPQKVREYEYNRMNYYYAVVECDKVYTAKAIYEACDGFEYEGSANFFDLRYIPDDTTFASDEVTDEAYRAPEHYMPKHFITQALQHSDVKLTWDDDDPDRIRTTRRSFTRQDIDAMDFSAYLASDVSDDDNEEDDEEDDGLDDSSDDADSEDSDDLAIESDLDSDASTTGPNSTSRRGSASKQKKKKKQNKNKNKMREKYLALLRANNKDAFASDHSDDEDEDEQDMEITFTPALSTSQRPPIGAPEPPKSHQANHINQDETTIEAYRRKHLERKQRRKAEAQQSADKDGENSNSPDNGHTRTQSKQQKAEDAAEETRRQAELDLLLMDDETLAAEARHFDMNEIIKSEKAKGRRRQRRRGKKGAEDDTAPIQEGFNINVADPRFAAVHESSTFAIDPTNPRFTKTKAMDELLSERRKRQRSTAN